MFPCTILQTGGKSNEIRAMLLVTAPFTSVDTSLLGAHPMGLKVALPPNRCPNFCRDLSLSSAGVKKAINRQSSNVNMTNGSDSNATKTRWKNSVSAPLTQISRALSGVELRFKQGSRIDATLA